MDNAGLIAIALATAIGVTAAIILYTTRPPRFAAKDRLLTPAEQRFYRCLASVIPPGWHLFAQVRYADLLDIVERGEHRRRLGLRAVAAKSADFVVCDTEFRPRLVIELNDRSHDQPDRKARDAHLAKVSERAGLPVIFTRVRTQYDLEDLRRVMSQAGI